MTKAEIQAQLDAAGIDYPSSATKAELMALVPPADKTTDQLTEEALDEATSQPEAKAEATPQAEPKPAKGVTDNAIITVRSAKHGSKTGTRAEIEAWRKGLEKKK